MPAVQAVPYGGDCGTGQGSHQGKGGGGGVSVWVGGGGITETGGWELLK